MEQFLIDLLHRHASHAHWIAFVSILLAGCHVPISLDLVAALCAVLAATVIPEQTHLLFGAVLVGCFLSASLAYWSGRLLGPQLQRWRGLRTLFTEERLLKVRSFYERYGLLTLVIGRFIPFGVRNCLFVSSGMSRLAYGLFLARDAIACTLWTTVFFSTFYFLGHNYQLLLEKKWMLGLLPAFLVTGIATVWYKRRKTSKPSQR